MKQIKKTLIIFIASMFVMAGILGNVTAKATEVVRPIINYVGVDHSPLVVGDTEKFTVTSKYDGEVQYRAFLFDGINWNELTNGYSAAVDAKTPCVLPQTSAFKLGKYKLSVWVKRAGQTGLSANKNYDNYYVAALNCVSRDNANRVYANGDAKVETSGLTVKINGIENIGGIKGPYIYRLFIFNPTTGAWTNGAKEYTESPSYTFDEAGTYVVVVHANTVNSKTWKNYLAGKTKGTYEAWKTVIVTVKNEEIVKVFDTSVKAANFGSTVNVTLTTEGVKRFATATQYQIFDGTKAVSAVTNLGSATTVFPAKAFGDKVSVKLFDTNAKEVKNIEVLLGQSGTISVSAISDDTDITSKFTDKYFKSYVYSLIGKTSPEPILYSDVKDITALIFNSGNMNNLSGIEYFTALTELNCYNEASIPDSSNTQYSAPGLTTLNVSKNSALTKLECRYNQLTTLDLSKNTVLTELYCEGNQLTTLDLSKNTKLSKVDCGGNKLTTLEFSKNPALTELVCWANKLTSLDVSKNTALTKLECGFNKLKTLDISNNAALPRLNCEYNELTTLKINPALTVLQCVYNQLTTLDVSKNTALTELNCQSNKLKTLDVSKNTALFTLYCHDNQLTTLDISKNLVLQDIQCTYNQLTTLFYNNKLTDQYNERETWFDWYKLQYTDSSHTKTTESLVMTAKD